jgi:hypothetical protein
MDDSESAAIGALDVIDLRSKDSGSSLQIVALEDDHRPRRLVSG